MRPMNQREWTAIVGRHNLNWPGQQITKPTADEWYGPLAGFPATEVWAAIDRHRQDLTPGRDGLPIGHWAPSLADLLACIDANWREASAARRELEARKARAASNGGTVQLAPKEWGEIRRVLEASKGVPGEPGHMLPSLARQRIEQQLIELNERVEQLSIIRGTT